MSTFKCCIVHCPFKYGVFVTVCCNLCIVCLDLYIVTSKVCVLPVGIADENTQNVARILHAYILYFYTDVSLMCIVPITQKEV